MPIRYNQSQGSRYQDEDDQILGLFFGGLSQGAASYERAKDRRVEADFRKRQLGMQESIARAEQKNRDRLAVIACSRPDNGSD